MEKDNFDFLRFNVKILFFFKQTGFEPVAFYTPYQRSIK